MISSAGWWKTTSYLGDCSIFGSIIPVHVSWQVSMMFSTVFLAYFPEIIGNSFFFLMAHEPYNNEILTFETFWPVFSKHFINTVDWGFSIILYCWLCQNFWNHAFCKVFVPFSTLHCGNEYFYWHNYKQNWLHIEESRTNQNWKKGPSMSNDWCLFT